MKHRRRTSASAGSWEWVLLGSSTEEGAKSDAEEIAAEINSSHYWSEHHRGVTWEVTTEAPKHVIEGRLNAFKSRLVSLNADIISLEADVANAKECECVGEKEYSCCCMHCGRVLKKCRL
jgi:hypothetical protein